MAARARAAMLALVSLAVACDIYYGVQRSARLEAAIEPDCVARVLAQVPGVTKAEHRHVAPNRWSWPHPSDTIDQYIFTGDDMWGVVEQAVAHDGAATLRLYVGQLNRRPPQRVIDRTRRAMDDAQRLLAKECPGISFVEPIHERCHGVSCG